MAQTRKKVVKSSKPEKPKPLSAAGKQLIEQVLNRKFRKKKFVNKDDCDSCGEKCFD